MLVLRTIQYSTTTRWYHYRNICLNLVVWSANSLTNRHPVISCPMRFAPEKNPFGKFIRGRSRSLCLDNLFPSDAHKLSYFLSANDVGPPACAEKASRQYLNQGCPKYSPIIVKAKANFVKAIPQIILRHCSESLYVPRPH